MRKLAKGVYFVDRQGARPQSSTDPDTILIFGWMNAKLDHLQKYSDKYHSLYPSAQILIVQSYIDWLWASQNSRNTYVQPIVRFLNTENLNSGPIAAVSRPILAHSFSNGGALILLHLLQMLSVHRSLPSSSLTASPFLLKAFVLDSAPGSGTSYLGLLRLFTDGVRSRIARYPMYAILSIIWTVLRLYQTLLQPKPFAIEKLRHDLNDGRLIPRDIKRLYLYSASDKLIMPEDVESHIEDAKRSGYEVAVEKFKTSAHVAHAQLDGTRYWNAVTRLWDSIDSDSTQRPGTLTLQKAKL